MIDYEDLVPAINLEPQIHEPLSWRNPIDYLILLYWLLRYPQAISSYTEKGQPQVSPSHPPNHPSIPKYFLLPSIESEYTSSSLGFIAYILWMIISLLCIFFYVIVYNWLNIGAISVALFSLGALCTVLMISVIYFSANGIAAQFFYLMISSHVASVSILFGIIVMSAESLPSQGFSVWIGILIAVVIGAVAKSVYVYLEGSMFYYGICYSLFCVIVLLVVFFVRWVLAENSTLAIVSTTYGLWPLVLAGTITAVLITLRLDDWVLSWMTWGQQKKRKTWGKGIPHVSMIKFPPLLKELKKHLKDDWKTGLKNAQQFINASQQEVYILNLINEMLDETPNEQIVERVAFLHNLPYSQKQIQDIAVKNGKGTGFIDRSLFPKLLPIKVDSQVSNLAIERKPLQDLYVIDTPVRAAIAGHQYLEQQYPELAQSAFQEIPSSSFGEHAEELTNLNTALLKILDTRDLTLKAPLELPLRPSKPQYTGAWDALYELKQFIRCTWVYKHSDYGNRRRIAHAAKQHLQDAISYIEELSEDTFKPIEKMLLAKSRQWLKELNAHYPNERIPKLGTVINPYVFSEPLSAEKLTISRKREKTLLDTAWQPGNFQPVLLYGQRHIGKTSIVFSMRAASQNKYIVLYINLKHLGIDVSVSKLFTAICKEIEYSTLSNSVDYLELVQSPYITFTGYTRHVCEELGATSPLVIVLDEIDHFETVSNAYNTQNNTLKFLWETSQTIPNLGFVFITSKTPLEIYKQYSNPFGTGLSPIQVGCITKDETYSLLQEPTDTFLPYYLDETIAQIYTMTSGHPYLIQIIAHSLIEEYNRQIQGPSERGPIFRAEDLRDIRRLPQFQRRLQRYSENVWNEVTSDDKLSGIALLYIALNEDNILDAEVSQFSTHAEQTRKLEMHNVVAKQSHDDEERWKIRMPLFEEWVREEAIIHIGSLLTSHIETPPLNLMRVRSDIELVDFGMPQGTPYYLRKSDVLSFQADTLYMMRDEEGKVLARCAVWYLNLAELDDTRVGLIGLYAAPNGLAGIQLLKLCYQELLNQRCEAVIGPIDRNTLYRFGLINNEDLRKAPRFFMEPDTSNANITQFAIAGFQPYYHFHSVLIESNSARSMFDAQQNNQVHQEYKISILDKEEALAALAKIYDTVINPSKNLSSFNISQDEFRNVYKQLLSFDCYTIAITLERGGDLIGFLFAIEDSLSEPVNRNVGTMVITMLEVNPTYERIAINLLQQCWQEAMANNFSRVIIKQISENSQLFTILKDRGIESLREYALYCRAP